MEAETTLEVVAVKLARETVKGSYGLVTAAELKAEIERGEKPILLDAMPLESSYQKEHLPGAVQFLFPIPDMPTWDSALTGGRSQADLEQLLGPNKAAPIVVYCGFVKCTRSHNAALWVQRLGYTKVRRFAGGVHAWKGAGFSLESSQP